MSEATIGEASAKRAGRNLVRTILIILGILLIFLVYAGAVTMTDINLERPLDPSRQESLIRVLRLLADPDILSVDEATGQLVVSEAARITVERIIETIFMALLASTIGTILAVPFSFLAARNLMEYITWPLASISAAIVALTAGGLIGARIAGQISGLTQFASDQPLVGVVILLAVAGLIWLVTRVGPPLLTDERRSSGMRFLTGVRIFLALALIIFGLAIVAQLGLLAGARLEDNLGPFGFLGNFIFVLSDLLRLLLPAIVGFLTAIIAASYASRFAQEAVLSWRITIARILTSVLMAFTTVILILAAAGLLNWLYQFALPSNWMSISAVVGGIMAGLVAFSVFPQILKSRTGPSFRFIKATVTVFKFLIISIGSGLVIYQISSFLVPIFDQDDPILFTLLVALVGSLPAAIFSLFMDPKHPFRIGFTVYTITRSILNVLRSIEPLIMGIVFVVWVSLGPFAGIMALTLHSIAALGKLFSEQVEGIDEGPVEAITATGAGRLQMVTYAVIPQIIPPFTAFALYRWDINVRMSTIIGFVGGGGIGFVLSQNIQQLRYRQASVMMLAIAIVVATLDYASSKIRSRII
ncbi:MAG: ABC transporter permease subunit [Chloroflexota bacterium]|jgi:phosphonate ABC transporter permease subunit PhnE